MINAIVSFSPNLLNEMMKSGVSVRIDEKISDFSFLEIVRSFRSGKVVKVQCEVASIDEIQSRIGDDFVVEEPSFMDPL